MVLTGFVQAALKVWRKTEDSARANETATGSSIIHGVSEMRYGKFRNHSLKTYHAKGVAII